MIYFGCRESAVGKATCYGLNVSGFRTRWEQDIVGLLFISFGFPKPSVTTWRWRRLRSLKSRGTLIPWRGCLTQNIWSNRMSLLHTSQGRCGSPPPPPPSSLLHNGYRVQSGRRMTLTSHFRLIPWLLIDSYFYSFSVPAWHVTGRPLPLRPIWRRCHRLRL